MTLDYPENFPQKDKKRGLRRYQKLRKRAKFLKKLRETFAPNRGWQNWINEVAYKQSEHPTACSCWMCGNPRKWFNGKKSEELTKQEKLAELREKDD